MATRKSKPDAEKAGRGRPTKYDPAYADQVRKLCLLGATDEELADFFEVAVTTIDNWKKEHPEFLGALKSGKAEADATVAESLYQRAKGYSHEAVKIFMPSNSSEPVYAPYVERYPPDTAAAFIWLKNRQGAKWKDKTEVQITGDLAGALAERRKRRLADAG